MRENLFCIPTSARPEDVSDAALRARLRGCLQVVGVDLLGASIAVTGHRPPGINGRQGDYRESTPAYQWTRRVLEALANFAVEGGALECITGMALGADTLWAEAVLDEDWRLVAAVPFRGQEKRWPAHAQERYHRILRRAEVHVLSEGPYHPGLMDARNEWMVQRADVVVAVWNGEERGGTWNCIQTARLADKPVIVLDPLEQRIKVLGFLPATRHAHRAAATSVQEAGLVAAM